MSPLVVITDWAAGSIAGDFGEEHLDAVVGRQFVVADGQRRHVLQDAADVKLLNGQEMNCLFFSISTTSIDLSIMRMYLAAMVPP